MGVFGLGCLGNSFWRRCGGGAALALALGLTARAQDYANPFDDPVDPFRKRSTIVLPRDQTPADSQIRSGIGEPARPSPPTSPAGSGQAPVAPPPPLRITSAPPDSFNSPTSRGLPVVSSVPGAAAPDGGGIPGGTPPRLTVDQLELRDDELRAYWIMLQREISAGRHTDIDYLHLRNLYQRLRDHSRPSGFQPAGSAARHGSGSAQAHSTGPAVPASGRPAEGYAAMMPPSTAARPASAAPTVDPRTAIHDELLAARRRDPRSRAALQDLAFYEMFMGSADRALDAWEAAGAESAGDMQYRLVHALLTLSLGQYEAGGQDIEQVHRLVERRRPFALSNAGFVTGVAAFRDFTPRTRKLPFQPGEAFRIYAELERTAFSRASSGDYHINVAVALSIFDEAGALVWRTVDIPPYALSFRGPVRDLNILVQHGLPDLPGPGKYLLVLHCRDQNSLQDAEIGVPFELAKGGRARSGSSAAASTSTGSSPTDGGVFGEPREWGGILKSVPRPPDDIYDESLFDEAPIAAAAPASPSGTQAPARMVSTPLSTTAPVAPSPEWTDFQRRQQRLAEAEQRYEEKKKRDQEYIQRLEAQLARAEKQVEKDRADLDRQRRDHERQQDLRQKAMQNSMKGMSTGLFQ